MFSVNNHREISHLYFDGGFSIDLGNNRIIYGSNGVGKSSIYKNIRSRHTEYSFIDYDDLRQSIISQKKKLTIGAKINQIEDKKALIDSNIGELNLKNNFKDIGITSKTLATEIFQELASFYDSHEKSVLEFNESKIEIISSFDDKDNLIKCFKHVDEFVRSENELLKIKDEYMSGIFSKLSLILEETSHVCPICDSTNDRAIVDIIREKQIALNNADQLLTKKYIELNASMSPSEINDKIINLKNFVVGNVIEKNDIASFIIAGGNVNNVETINSTKNSILNLKNEISLLEQERDLFYANLKEKEQIIKDIFKTEFKVSETSIVFDDNDKVISITLDRPVESYSTGEINLMVFIVSINEFIASDKVYLVIDDPLSSYDLKNQYKIVYETLSVLSPNKKVIIFTHNIDTINIINSQKRGLFTYQNIEKINETLFLNNININANDSVLNIENLYDRIANTNPFKIYLKLLIEKDGLPGNDPLHKIFHYDSSFSIQYQGLNLTNDYLEQLIENFNDNTFINSDFENNSLLKIIYMSAIRVWIEKKFSEAHPNDANLTGKLVEKINYLFPDAGTVIWNGNPLVNRKYLMSKKVMLNQHNHYKSQILPFHYAISLTLDEIKDEILDLKLKFQ